MLYKALVSFTGVVSMTMGEVKQIDNPQVVKDLLNARYIAPVKEEKKAVRKTTKK